jgi:hypothetical protein
MRNNLREEEARLTSATNLAPWWKFFKPWVPNLYHLSSKTAAQALCGLTRRQELLLAMAFDPSTTMDDQGPTKW